jgi:hypothetical protein
MKQWHEMNKQEREERAAESKRFDEWAWKGGPGEVPIGLMHGADAGRAAWIGRGEEDKKQLSGLRRMWIDQPSTLQPLHHLHGTRVLGYKEYEGTYRVFFLEGDIVSQQAPSLCLGEGWPG